MKVKVSQDLGEIFIQKGAQKEPKKPPIEEIPSLEDLKILKMTETAFRKVSCTLRAAFAASGRAVESYWLYMGDGIVRDIIVPQQTVSGAHVQVHFEDILELKDTIRQSDLPIMGWGHSHANFGVFFSGTDWANQERLLHETSNIVFLQDENRQIKYVYGSTFNIHGDTYIQFTYTGAAGQISHEKIGLQIIPAGSAGFNEAQYMEDLALKFSHY